MELKPVSPYGPPPKFTRPRRTEVNSDTNARGIVDCKFCAQSFKRCDHALRHVKAKHTLEQVSMYAHCETVANSPEDGHITGLFTKHITRDAKYCHGYCWDCHHWIPGVTMVQLLTHECKTRKPYERKAQQSPPPKVVEVIEHVESDDDEEKEDTSEQEKWDDVRDVIGSTLRRHTQKWAPEEKARVMALVHESLNKSDAMDACTDILRALADLTRAAAAPVTISPASVAPSPAPPAATPAAPPAATPAARLRTVTYTL